MQSKKLYLGLWKVEQQLKVITFLKISVPCSMMSVENKMNYSDTIAKKIKWWQEFKTGVHLTDTHLSLFLDNFFSISDALNKISLSY